MQTCMLIAGYDSNEADSVRKILGKKQVEKAGQEFVSRAVGLGFPEPAVRVLWDQMAEFAKYGFGKAHAFGYSTLGYWTGWFRFHFPLEFLTAALGTVDDDRIPEFINDCRREGFEVLPPDINISGVDFTPGAVFTPGQTSVRYGLASVSGIGEATARQVVAGAPYSSLTDFVDRQVSPSGSKVNKGHLATLVAVGAFDSMTPNRRAAELQLEADASGASKTCVSMDKSVLGPGGLPCTFDWEHEPDPPTVRVGKGKDRVEKAKPPPKRCTVACRQYTKPEPIMVDLVRPYADEDIRAKEKQLLGVWLSSTPFDRLDPGLLEAVATADEVEEGPLGPYLVAAIVEGVRPKQDRNGNTYVFATLNALNGSLDAHLLLGAPLPLQARPAPRRPVDCRLTKNDRGINLVLTPPGSRPWRCPSPAGSSVRPPPRGRRQ